MYHDRMTDSGIVADGQERAIRGAREQIAELRVSIQAVVESEYKPRLAAAGILQWFCLRLAMKREVKRRIAIEIEKIAPSHALYAKR